MCHFNVDDDGFALIYYVFIIFKYDYLPIIMFLTFTAKPRDACSRHVGRSACVYRDKHMARVHVGVYAAVCLATFCYHCKINICKYQTRGRRIAAIYY